MASNGEDLEHKTCAEHLADDNHEKRLEDPDSKGFLNKHTNVKGDNGIITRRDITRVSYTDLVPRSETHAKISHTLREHGNKKARTKWRHALRHPLTVEYRKKLEAMLPGSREYKVADRRIQEIDRISAMGTEAEKKIFLTNTLKFILPRFYSIKCKTGQRYPGDGGPDPQVETDHESDKEWEDLQLQQQDGNGARHKRTNLSTKQKHVSARKLFAKMGDEQKQKFLAKKLDQKHRRNKNVSPRPSTERERMSCKLRMRSFRERQSKIMANLSEEQQTAAKARESEKRRTSEKKKALRKSRALTYHHNTKVNAVDLSLLGAALARQWHTNPEFERFKIQLAQDEGSIFILDVEFSQVLRKVFEVALGRLKSGKVLIDNRIRHDCTDTELFTLPNGQAMGLTNRSILLGTLKNVYGSSDRRTCSGLRNPAEMAEMIIEAGVTPKSIIVVWHQSTTDLDLLRELIESAGYYNVLPPKANCIRMIPQFRANLPPKFTAKLDMLFPLLFAGHQLVGTNHRAGPDIQMLRIMTLLYIQLQKPPAERDLSDFPGTTQEYIMQARVPRTELQKWLGVGFTLAPTLPREATQVASRLLVEDESGRDKTEELMKGLE